MDKKQQEILDKAIDQKDAKLFEEIVMLITQMSPIGILALRKNIDTNIHSYVSMAIVRAKKN